jgi:hypothetical protein
MAKLIVPIVEGKGEVKAVQSLLARWFKQERKRYEFKIAEGKSANGRHNLLKPGGIESFLGFARNEKAVGCVVIIDSEGDCPVIIACDLAQRARQLNLPFPTVIVCAHCEYETWFLASLPTIAQQHEHLPDNLTYTKPVEDKRNVKGWFTDQMPPGRAYKETQDQPRMTEWIGFNLARTRSRSFQRLEHALEELLSAIDNQQTHVVTPSCSADTLER